MVNHEHNSRMKKWDAAITALQDIAAAAKKMAQTPEVTYNQTFTTPMPVDETPLKDRVPAYFMPPEVDEISIDDVPSHGYAVVKENEIVIILPKAYWPDTVRQVIGDPDLEARRIAIGFNYDKKRP